eukprot:g8238.t1
MAAFRKVGSDSTDTDCEKDKVKYEKLRAKLQKKRIKKSKLKERLKRLKNKCFVYLEKHQGGKYYDCNDNGRARAAGNSQACIDEVLSKPNPFDNGKKVIVHRNWGPCGSCACKSEYGIFLEGGEKVASDNKDDEDTRKKIKGKIKNIKKDIKELKRKIRRIQEKWERRKNKFNCEDQGQDDLPTDDNDDDTPDNIDGDDGNDDGGDDGGGDGGGDDGGGDDGGGDGGGDDGGGDDDGDDDGGDDDGDDEDCPKFEPKLDPLTQRVQHQEPVPIPMSISRCNHRQ